MPENILKMICTKIAKNWEKINIFWAKFTKTGGFEQFWVNLWQIYGTYGLRCETKLSQDVCTKIHIFFNISIQIVLEMVKKWDI